MSKKPVHKSMFR